MFFNYGIDTYDKAKFKQVDKVMDDVNKLSGGIWCCPKNDVYSNWFVLTLYCPCLVDSNQKIVGNNIKLKDNSSILTLTTNNYKEYTKNEILDLSKLKNIDAILFTQDLVDNIKSFESYYFESLQILNDDCIESIEKEKMNVEYILSEEFKEKANEIFCTILTKLQGTDVFAHLAKNLVK